MQNNEETPVIVTIKYPEGHTLEYHLDPRTVKMETSEEDGTHFFSVLDFSPSVPPLLTLTGRAHADDSGTYAWLNVSQNGENNGAN